MYAALPAVQGWPAGRMSRDYRFNPEGMPFLGVSTNFDPPSCAVGAGGWGAGRRGCGCVGWGGVRRRESRRMGVGVLVVGWLENNKSGPDIKTNTQINYLVQGFFFILDFTGSDPTTPRAAPTPSARTPPALEAHPPRRSRPTQTCSRTCN